jgi:Zn-dependent peptidase ImmA (M78 family)
VPTASAQLAEKVLRSFNLWRLPVQPLEIATQEGIVIRSGFFGEGFDARIEYYRSHEAFCIFHAEPGGWRTEGRVRFSLAHELAHFYLPL